MNNFGIVADGWNGAYDADSARPLIAMPRLGWVHCKGRVWVSLVLRIGCVWSVLLLVSSWCSIKHQL